MAQKGGIIPNIIRNRATLYSVFFLSIVYLFFLLLNYDFPSVFFFGLVGLVSSFFTRNMLIVLAISLIVTIVLKSGGVLGAPPMPPSYPVSETVTTTELIVFDDEGNPITIHDTDDMAEVFEKKFRERHHKEINEQIHDDVNIDVDVDIEQEYQKPPRVVEPEPEEHEPSINELLMVPGYQSSIMLANDAATLDFDNPIELMPVDMDKGYGYEFNNPFSKFGQKCGVSDQYSCFSP